jgi:hypothetical protein
MEKPFILFSGQTYYSVPGWYGYVGDFKTLEEAIETGNWIINDDPLAWWQVVDFDQKIIVAGKGVAHTGLFGEISVGPLGKEKNE